AGMAAVLLAWQMVLPPVDHLVAGGGGVVLGVGAYLAVATLLQADELKEVGRLVLRRGAS
ncbi:MAG: hypothetical protein PVH62_10245, partial [Anaerolineae bacterium]